MINKDEEIKSKTISKKTDKIDSVYEKGKKLMEKINSNLYDISNKPKYDNYINPFEAAQKIKDEEFDTIDKIDILEYDYEFLKKEEQIEKSISQDEESDVHNIDMKDYDNFIFKIEDLIISDHKTLNLFKDNLLYLECRVPLFKIDNNTNNNEKNLNGVFYDTFK